MARIPKQRVIFDAEKYDLDYLRETRDSYSPMTDAEFEDSISYDMGEDDLRDLMETDWRSNENALDAFLGKSILVRYSPVNYDDGFVQFNLNDLHDLLHAHTSPLHRVDKVWDEDGHLFLSGKWPDNSPLLVEVRKLTVEGERAMDAILTADRRGDFDAVRGTFHAMWDDPALVSTPRYAELALGMPAEDALAPLPLDHITFDDEIAENGDKLYVSILDDLNDAPDEVRACWDESTGIWDDLYEAGYTGIDMNLDDLLSRSSFNVNLFFATETEKNFDMGSIVDSFGNDYREPRLEDIDAESLDNALSYLVNQQGHSVEEVFGNPDNAFIHSIREEIDENSSEAMSELCALVRMDAREMLDLIGKRSEAKGSLVLPRDCATMGIFNQWSGCGGVLDILLEKDAVMPLSMIRGFQIEGQSDPEGYTVNDVYGLVGSCWKPAQLSDDIETDVKEDYALALQKARATGWEIEEQEAAEPVSLKAAVKESRAASEALVAHGASAVDLEHEADNARTAASPLSKPDGDR